MTSFMYSENITEFIVFNGPVMRIACGKVMQTEWKIGEDVIHVIHHGREFGIQDPCKLSNTRWNIPAVRVIAERDSPKSSEKT